MRRWLIPLSILLILVLVGGAGYMGFHSTLPTKPQAPQAPPTVPVTRGDVRQIVTAPGQLIRTREATIEAKIGGRLEQIDIRAGDTVTAGQVLARLETSALASAVRDATAELEQARFNLQKAQRAAEAGTDLAAAAQAVEAARLGVITARGQYSSTLLHSDVTVDVQQAKFWSDYWQSELGDAWLRLNERPESESRRIQYEDLGARAAREHNRMLQITQDAENSLTSAQRSMASAQQAYLSALSNYNTLKNGDPVREAQLKVLQAETKLTKSQTDLEGAALTAPFSGVVLEVKARVGETVAAGAALITIADPQALEARVTAVEEDWPLVQAGQAVDLYFDARPDVSVKGKVSRIVPQRDSGDRAIYPVYVTLDQSPGGLAAGMTVDSSIITANRTGVLRLPRALVRARSDGTAQVKVWTMGRSEDRTVKVGLRGDTYVEILDGLREGEQVVSK